MLTLSISSSSLDFSQTLRNQLSQFGLNPQDWVTYPLKGGNYCAIHIEDQDWVLVGQVDILAGRPRWVDLVLLEE